MVGTYTRIQVGLGPIPYPSVGFSFPHRYRHYDRDARLIQVAYNLGPTSRLALISRSLMVEARRGFQCEMALRGVSRSTRNLLYRYSLLVIVYSYRYRQVLVNSRIGYLQAYSYTAYSYTPGKSYSYGPRKATYSYYQIAASALASSSSSSRAPSPLKPALSARSFRLFCHTNMIE